MEEPVKVGVAELVDEAITQFFRGEQSPFPIPLDLSEAVLERVRRDCPLPVFGMVKVIASDKAYGLRRQS